MFTKYRVIGYSIVGLFVTIIFVLVSREVSVNSAAAQHTSEGTVFLPLTTNWPRSDAVLEEIEENNRDYRTAILNLEQGIEVTPSGEIVLSYINPDPSIPLDVYDGLITSLGQTNELVSTGELDLIDVELDSTDLFLEADPAFTNYGTVFKVCRGFSGLRYYWWGPALFIKSCDVDYFLETAQVGAHLLCAGIGVFGSPVGGVLCEAATQLYRWYLITLNRYGGRGVWIGFIWWSIPRIYLAWHQ